MATDLLCSLIAEIIQRIGEEDISGRRIKWSPVGKVILEQRPQKHNNDNIENNGIAIKMAENAFQVEARKQCQDSSLTVSHAHSRG